MRFSVVIPAYNEEQYLPSCLQSLREQDFQGDYEVIVVDNGSTDRTAEVARRYGAQVIICPRKGVAYARAAGAEAARGEIIVQTDADAVLPPDWLSRVDRHFARHPQDVALAGSVRYHQDPFWHRLWSLPARWVNLLTRRIGRGVLLPMASNFAVRRAALVVVGGYDLSLPFAGDEDGVCPRLRRVGHVAYDPSLVVMVSARRFQGRFWQATFADQMCRLVFPFLPVALRNRLEGALRPDIRVVRRPRLPVRLVAAVSTLFLLLVGIGGYGFFVPGAQAFGKIYTRQPATDRVIALTFDDGPNDPYTSQILNILAHYRVKATFFVVGKNVEYYPETARRIINEGHVVGNHSWDHREFEPLVDIHSREIARAQQAIERTTGVRPRLFRPPYGQKTPWQLAAAREQGMIVVAWSLSANDPKQPPPGNITARVLRHASPGAILLLHDGYETYHGGNRSNTTAALPEIIETLLAQAYRFVTVPELLAVQPYLTSHR
jgi:peptidoglycan/xylan/chitin deacetylase (PgdA/CDA1 family)